MAQDQNNKDMYAVFKSMSNFALAGWGLAIILLNVVFVLLDKLGVF